MAQTATNYDNVPVHTGMRAPKKQAPGEEPSIGQMLEKALPHIKMALPKNMDPDRMARIALTTIRRDQKLLTCKASSLAGAVLEAASLGLEIDSRGLAYLVPYGNSVKLIVGYKGLMQLAYRSGKLNNIYADVVFKKEVEEGYVSIALGAERNLRHDFDILASAPLRKESAENPIVLAYAVAVFKDGSKHFEFVTEAEVKKRKGVSAAGSKSFLWNDWKEEGWKKTAIRKLCKYMDLSPEAQRAIVLDEQADAEISQTYDLAGTVDISFASNAEEDDPPALESAETVNPETGEVTSAPAPRTEPDMVQCPNKDNALVDERGCATCSQYVGCPAFAS